MCLRNAATLAIGTTLQYAWQMSQVGAGFEVWDIAEEIRLYQNPFSSNLPLIREDNLAVSTALCWGEALDLEAEKVFGV